MAKRLLSVILVITIVAAVFGGCDALNLNSPENLVRPPKLSGSDGELQDAFEKAVSEKGEFILKYPSAGNYKSAFVRQDCDGDSYDEAFVFYSLKTEEMSVYMHILDYKDGEWISVGDIPGEGNDIYSIEFCDLNSDSVKELLVGWSSIDSKANKKLGIYCADTTKEAIDYKAIAVESYTELFAYDIDSDGNSEILLTLINSTSDTYTTEAKLLKMQTNKNGNQINMTGQVSLYSGITAINKIATGLSGGKRYIYIDEAAGDSYLTEILYWDNQQNALVAALIVDAVSIVNCPTGRSLPLICTDVDNDGELEIPVTKMMKDSSVVFSAENQQGDIATLSATTENVYVTSWKKFDDGKFTSVDSYIENTYDSFRIAYDEETMSNWSVRFFADEGISEFFILEESEIPEETAQAVRLFSIVKKEKTSSETDIVIASDNVYTFTCEITEIGEELGIDKQKITEMFSVLGTEE